MVQEVHKIREKVHELIKGFYAQRRYVFSPGKSKIHYSVPLFGEQEVNAVIDSLLDGWLAEGVKTAEFEAEFKGYIGAKDCVVVNSGSSALLLAFAVLCNKATKNRLEVGDEVVTSALTFPTTINAIILNGLTPVFVDVGEDYNINPELIETAVSKKTRAILVTHHLGYPCDMDRILEIAGKHNLYVIEDCCDAHGAEYKSKRVGSFGDMACFSFYCAHAMTMGEGGAVVSNTTKYRPTLLSLKTCGRACVCPVCTVTLDSEYNCPIRWASDIDGFEGYDKRTLYTDIGYKFKILDLQSAFGLEQLKKLPCFIEKRLENFNYLVSGLKEYEKYLILPCIKKHVRPCWFSVPITIREDAPFTRKDIVNWLEKRNIETRPLLGGDLTKQPAYSDVQFRKTALPNTEFFHRNSFYIGCHPGMTMDMMDYVVKMFREFFESLD